MSTIELMPPVLANDADAWALRINASWRRSLETYIETGQLLIDAKKQLAPHGTWLSLLESKLDFDASTAQRLMAIARDPRITNPAHGQFLPRSYRTLYELTKLSDEEFERGRQEDIIRHDMERKDVEKIRPTPHRERAPQETQSADEHEPAQAGEDGPLPSSTAAPRDDLEAADPATVKGADGDDQPQAPPASLPGGGLAIAHSRVEPLDGLDFFPTPPWATRALIEHVFDQLGRKRHCGFQTVWEPACGEGHMAEPLKEYFREVVASDVKDYGYGDHTVDFLTCEQLARKYDADWIITNPPFGENTDKFILKALELAGTGVAMLVRLQCLETVGRYEKIFSKTPPTKIAFFVERVPMHKGRWEPDGATMTAYIWLVWVKGAEPQAPFWIPPGCREALSKPDDVARFAFPTSNEAPAAEAAE